MGFEGVLWSCFYFCQYTNESIIEFNKILLASLELCVREGEVQG